MRQGLYQVLTAATVSVALLGGAAAQTTRHRGHSRAHVADHGPYGRRTHAYASVPYDGQRGLGYEHPAYGYEEAPYDPRYAGPGAVVFNATRRAAHEPGVTNELAPDAKETATGGPSGGVPGFDGQ